MLADRLDGLLRARSIHYAWVVVVLTFLTMLVTAGAMGLPGALMLPLNSEFHWSIADISSALALRIALFGLMAPFSAAFMNRFGLRAVITTAVVLIAGALLLATTMTAYWQLLVLWGIVVGVGTGLTAMVLGATVANRWFVKRRGLILGLLTASSATGQLVFLPLATIVVSHWGWRMAVFPTVGACGVVGLLVILFMRDRPSDLRLAAYGDPTGAVVPASAGAGSDPIRQALAALGMAAKVPAFWALFATFFICGLSTNGLIQSHFIAFCADYGLPGTEAASVIALMGLFDFFGTIMSGWLSDRFDNRWLLFWYYGLRGLSLLWLPHSSFTFYGLSIFALFYGLDWIATVPPTVGLANKVFGRASGAMVFGWIFTGHQLGAAFATFAAGQARTSLATYLPAFYAAGAACLIAALVALLIRPDQRETGVVAIDAAKA